MSTYLFRCAHYMSTHPHMQGGMTEVCPPVVRTQVIAKVDQKLDGLPPSNKELMLIKTRMQALSYDTGSGARQVYI